jgi:hypothetical protein
MKDFLDKLQDFLFDILGIILPGLILIFCLIAPCYFIKLSEIPNSEIESSTLLSSLNWASRIIHQVTYNDYFFILLLIIAYVVGHPVKVFSKIQYEIFRSIFDRFLNKLFLAVYGRIKQFFSWTVGLGGRRTRFFKSNFYGNLHSFFRPLRELVSGVFVFTSPEYYSESEGIRKETVALLRQKLDPHFPDDWYPLYKFSTVVMIQENIKSLAGNYLAKYNLYRSLAFIFLFSLFYFLYFVNVDKRYLYNGVESSKGFLLIVIVLSWYSFHVKFKRYWTLCGNESLMSLYCYLNKEKIKPEANERQDTFY